MSRLGEPEHLLFVEEGGGVGGSSRRRCLGEGCSLEETQVAAVPGRWRCDGDALLQPHHIPDDSELHGHSRTATTSSSAKLSTHLGLGEKKSRLLMGENGCWCALLGTGW